MPTQGNSTTELYTYGVHDTGPPLVYTMRDRDKNVIDLTDAQKVMLSVGHTSYDHHYIPTQEIVDRQDGVIVDAVNGVVEYHWQTGDLKAVGRYDFGWEIVWNDGSVQTVRSLSYDHIKVQAAPFANRGAYTP